MIRRLGLSGFLLLVAWTWVIAQPRAEQVFTSRVSQQRLVVQVRELVRLGNRLGGTPSGDAAASHILTAFRRAGLSAKMVQDSPKLTFVHRGWQLRVLEPRRIRGDVRSTSLAGFSPPTKRSKARLVFLDDDEAPDREQVEGTVVLTPRYVDARFYGDVAGAGALALVSFYPADSTRYERWALMADLPPSEANPIPLYTVSYFDGMRLVRLAEEDTVRMQFSATTRVFSGSPRTVIATLPGKEESYYLFCAHGDADSGGPGADDNASGVSGVLEVARVLNGMIRDGVIAQPQFSIHFVIWGSEYASSTQYVRDHATTLSDIKGVINFDEIGTGKVRNCLYCEPNDVEWNKPLLQAFQDVVDTYAGKKGFWREATTNPAQGGTDSYVFMPDYLARIGLPDVKIPAVTMFTAAWDHAREMAQTEGWSSPLWMGNPDSVTIDFSPVYHSLRDVPERTTDREPFNMVWGAKAAGLMLLRLAWEPRAGG